MDILHRVVAEKERVLAQAKEEADRIRELARQEAEELIKRDAIVQAAHQRAEAVQARAERAAASLREDADLYSLNVLAKLEDDLLRSLNVVRNGLQKLQSEYSQDPEPAGVLESTQKEANISSEA